MKTKIIQPGIQSLFWFLKLAMLMLGMGSLALGSLRALLTQTTIFQTAILLPLHSRRFGYYDVT